VLRGIDLDGVVLRDQLPCERVKLNDTVDVIAEELDADSDVVVGGQDLQRVAPNAETAARQVVVVALVLHLDEPT